MSGLPDFISINMGKGDDREKRTKEVIDQAEKIGFNTFEVRLYPIDGSAGPHLEYLKSSIARIWRGRFEADAPGGVRDMFPACAFIFSKDKDGAGDAVRFALMAPLFNPGGPGAAGARHLLRDICAQDLTVTAAAFASETWGLEMAAGKTRADYPANLSKYDGPDRIEALHLIYERRGEKPRVFMARILRGVESPELGDFEEHRGDGDISGNAIGYF